MEIGRESAAVVGSVVDPNNVDRLRQVEDIATDLNLISGPVLGDGPTSIFRMVESDFCHVVVM